MLSLPPVGPFTERPPSRRQAQQDDERPGEGGGGSRQGAGGIIGYVEESQVNESPAFLLRMKAAPGPHPPLP